MFRTMVLTRVEQEIGSCVMRSEDPGIGRTHANLRRNHWLTQPPNLHDRNKPRRMGVGRLCGT